MAGAYFACVNANGGINGHPIKYYIQNEQTNPSQIASLAKQLVHTDHVVGIVGNTSIIECSSTRATGRSVGFYVIDSGIAPECYSTPNSAAVNMGPRYSSDGAVQYASHAAPEQDRLRPVQRARHGLHRGRPERDRQGRERADPGLHRERADHRRDSVAIKLVNAAGTNGAVVLNFTPPEALSILQAAQKLNLEDRVKLWACSTPCNTDFLATALGPKWNNKLFVNAELTPLDGTTRRP